MVIEEYNFNNMREYLKIVSLIFKNLIYNILINEKVIE